MRLLLFAQVVLACCALILANDSPPKKRQIYREQVLPHFGGKIPETAFQSDRLFLNRLQSEGIAVPDGVVPEARNPYVYQYHNKSPRTVYRIALSSDGRYTPAVGKYHYRDLPAVDTTYLYPLTHIQHGRFATTIPLNSATFDTTAAAQTHSKSKTPITTAAAPAYKAAPIVYPVYRQFQLYNSNLNPVKLQPHKKIAQSARNHLPNVNSNNIINNKINHDNNNNNHIKTIHPYKSTSYQNFNLYNIDNNVDDLNRAAILDVPTVKSSSSSSSNNGLKSNNRNANTNTKHLSHTTPLTQYNANQLFNEFDELFNSFDLYEHDDSTLQHRYKSSH